MGGESGCQLSGGSWFGPVYFVLSLYILDIRWLHCEGFGEVRQAWTDEFGNRQPAMVLNLPSLEESPRERGGRAEKRRVAGEPGSPAFPGRADKSSGDTAGRAGDWEAMGGAGATEESTLGRAGERVSQKLPLKPKDTAGLGARGGDGEGGGQVSSCPAGHIPSFRNCSCTPEPRLRFHAGGRSFGPSWRGSAAQSQKCAFGHPWLNSFSVSTETFPLYASQPQGNKFSTKKNMYLQERLWFADSAEQQTRGIVPLFLFAKLLFFIFEREYRPHLPFITPSLIFPHPPPSLLQS